MCFTREQCCSWLESIPLVPRTAAQSLFSACPTAPLSKPSNTFTPSRTASAFRVINAHPLLRHPVCGHPAPPGYRYNPQTDAWKPVSVFPRWQERYPEPVDFIGVTRIYDPRIDKPVKTALQVSLGRTYVLECCF